MIDDPLHVEEFRAGLLEHSREAYRRLSLPDRPRILDIGCGSGLTTIELAHLGGRRESVTQNPGS